MLLNWLLRLLIPYWEDLCLNPLTGKPSLKNVAATGGFIVGIILACVSVWADVQAGRPVEKSAIMLLLANALGLSVLKVWQQQANRQTATPEGQPLAAPLPPGESPPIMPQVENPNAPGNTEADHAQ
jgi:hypothetical protein